MTSALCKNDLVAFVALLDLSEDAPRLPSPVVDQIGDSMSPVIRPGDKVIVDQRQRFPSPGGLFVAWQLGQPVICNLEHVPYSDPPTVRLWYVNEMYPGGLLDARDLQVAGRVAWVCRRT